VTGTVVRYVPRGAAKSLLECRDAQVVIAGPAGTGKSLAALTKVFLACLMNPGIRCLIARKTAVSLTSTTLVTFDKKVAVSALEQGIVRWFGGSARESPAYRFTNGSAIVVGGLDKPEKILSSEYDLVFVDEATELTITDWETIGTRLRNGALSFQQQIAACNPVHPTHWINQRSNESAMRMLVSRHTDNPAYVNEDGSYTPQGAAYMAILDSLTGVRRLRLRDGKWAAAEGLVFDDWKEAVHLVDPFEIPAEWTRYWAIDWGFTNPTVVQWWAEDPDGRLYLYRELVQTQKTPDQIARQCIALCSTEDPDYVHQAGEDRYAHHGRIWSEPRPARIFADHAAGDRVLFKRETGLSVRAAEKDVAMGIQAMQRRLRIQGDGKPRMFVMSHSLVMRDVSMDEAKQPIGLAEEIAGYVWAVKPGNKGGLKEEPVKEADHSCLVAGTQVMTPDGPVAIEQIEPGDLVITRRGPRPVVASGMTSTAAAVYRVALSDGGSLTGTGNHPVWVGSRGWVRLDALRYADSLTTCQSNMFDSTGSSSAATPTPPPGPTGTTTSPVSVTERRASPGSTWRCGSPSMGTSPKAAKFTTRTSTLSTMTLTTSSVSQGLNTTRRTLSSGASGGGLPSHWSTWRTYAPSLSSGTAPVRALNGTGSTPNSRGSAVGSGGQRSAISAAAATRRSVSMATAGSAQTAARPHGDMRVESMTSSVSACAAVTPSRSTGMPESGAAPVHVLSVTAFGSAPVYNLTVSDQPEYFAGGVLVHNCDAARYMSMARDRRTGGKLRFM
jgi:PBSX family phage terminase large subunit